MKIGITTDILRNKKTGVEKYTEALLVNLVKEFPEQEFYVIKQKGIHSYFSNFKTFETKKRPKFFGSRFLYSLVESSETFKEFDLIHCPTHEAPFFKKIKTKTVITIHDLTPLVLPFAQKLNRVVYFKFFLKPLLENFDHIIADSFATKKDLIKFLGQKEDKISVVHLGCDEIFQPKSPAFSILERYGLEPGYIFYAGTIEPRKNILRLLMAFEKVREKIPIKLVIAGGLGWKYKKILKKIKKTPDVVFLGYVSDMELLSLYNGCKVFVYPSLYEGFGLPVLEAMTCGKPVITSNTSSLPEIAGDSAVLINPFDIDNLAREIIKLLEDQNWCQELSEKAKKRAQNFSWKKTAQKTFEVYKKVLGL